MKDNNSRMKIHFSGIKGVGMTALALYLEDLGHTVSGSDVEEEFVTQDILVKRKIPVSISFSAVNVPKDIDLLIYSAARPSNPQVEFAAKHGIETMSYAQALPFFTKGKETIAVCGVGGKTTTTAMIATVLDSANMKPSFIDGVGNIPNLGVPGKYADGKYLVLESDDYASVPGIDDTPKFLYLKPKIIVVTNIEFDHPDVYPNIEATKQAFLQFFCKLPEGGSLIANIDNQNIQSVLSEFKQKKINVNILTYGFSPQADYRIGKVLSRNQSTFTKIEINKSFILDLKLKVPGKFNVANACSSIMVSAILGVSQQKAAQSLSSFRGTSRRFEYVGSYHRSQIWDDYAHHPKEVEATLKAAREWFPEKRIVVIFQPHTFSRTKALLKDFSRSLSLADECLITEIFSSAREKKDSSISSHSLLLEIKKTSGNCKLLEPDKMLKYLTDSLSANDVLITMGAGDIYKLAHTLAKLDEK